MLTYYAEQTRHPAAYLLCRADAPPVGKYWRADVWDDMCTTSQCSTAVLGESYLSKACSRVSNAVVLPCSQSCPVGAYRNGTCSLTSDITCAPCAPLSPGISCWLQLAFGHAMTLRVGRAFAHHCLQCHLRHAVGVLPRRLGVRDDGRRGRVRRGDVRVRGRYGVHALPRGLLRRRARLDDARG